MVSQSTLLPPQLAIRSGRPDDPLECSVHTLPKPLLREFQHVFGQEYLEEMAENVNTSIELLAIPTNQQARKDLVAVGDDIEFEKDRLLNVVRCARVCFIQTHFCAILTILVLVSVYGIWRRIMQKDSIIWVLGRLY